MSGVRIQHLFKIELYEKLSKSPVNLWFVYNHRFSEKIVIKVTIHAPENSTIEYKCEQFYIAPSSGHISLKALKMPF